MQAGGQFGPSEVQQFMVTGPHARMFSLAHDVVMPTGGAHRQHQQQQQHQTHEQAQNHQTQIQQPQPQPHQQQSQRSPQHHIHSQQQLQNYQQHQQVNQPLELSPDSPEPHSPLSSRPSQSSFKQLTAASDSLVNDDGMEEDEKGSGANRWPRQESLALIKIRTDMDSSFRDSGLKGPLWEEVSRKLAELGYHRSAKKCKEKFENVHKYYKKTKDGRAGRHDGKNYRFFSQLEALYGGTAYGSGWGVASGTSGAGSRLENSTPSKEGRGIILTNDGGLEIAPRSKGRAAINEDINISSDFSEGDYDEPGDANPPESKNRKRKSFMTQMLLFENVLKKFVDKQEAMHRKFLDAFERREQERIIREEVWKRQEVARINRDMELQAQERSLATSRDAALVTFLQKVTGQTLQFPPPPAPTAGAPLSKPVEISTDNQAEQKQVPDPNNRWPKAEVLALIRLRSDMEARFQEPGPKGALWGEIGKGMSDLGYNRNAKRCKEKWENINKYFRKTKESSKKRSEDAKTCPYFHQLDTLYRTGVLNAPTGKPLKTEDQAAEILDRPAQGTKDDRGHAQGEALLTILPSDEGHPQVANGSNAQQAHMHSGPDEGSNYGELGLEKVN